MPRSQGSRDRRPHAKAGASKPPVVVAKRSRSAALPQPVRESSPTPTAHAEAVSIFERGLAALHEHDYVAASAQFHGLLDGHPSEPELHDRARIFLAFCERHLDHPTTPRTLEERVDAATIALNRGRFDEAEHLLSRVTRDAPNHDYAHFMLAVARTGRGAFDAALAALDRAVALNPENRLLALREPDLEPLRRVTGFQRTVTGAAGATRAAR